jgi:hypothetical protein
LPAIRVFTDAALAAEMTRFVGREEVSAMASAPMIDAPTISTTRFEYLVVPLKEAKSVKKEEDVFAPEQLNELGEQGWEAVGLSLKYGDLMAWPVVLLKRPLY